MILTGAKCFSVPIPFEWFDLISFMTLARPRSHSLVTQIPLRSSIRTAAILQSTIPRVAMGDNVPLLGLMSLCKTVSQGALATYES